MVIYVSREEVFKVNHVLSLWALIRSQRSEEKEEEEEEQGE